MLGAATVLCVDKTGTLTQNQMTCDRSLEPAGFSIFASLQGALPEEFHGLLENAILASERDPFDPMDRRTTRGGRSVGQRYGASASELVAYQGVPLSARTLGCKSRLEHRERR